MTVRSSESEKDGGTSLRTKKIKVFATVCVDFNTAHYADLNVVALKSRMDGDGP